MPSITHATADSPAPSGWAGRVLSTLRRAVTHPYALYVAVCLAVWLPDGLNIGPANDGWRDVSAGPFEWDPALRYFGKLPKYLGLHLVRDGFQGWELMLFVVTVLRAVVLFEIFKRLFPRYRSFAVACGLLALFHPADRVYFWMDSMGLDFDYLIALTACLAAVVYLQTRSRESLMVLVFLQVVLCFSYTAYLPVVFVFAIGIWIFRFIEGHHDKLSYFLAASLPTLLAIGFQALLAVTGRDREGHLLDGRLGMVASGYVHEAGLLVPMFMDVFQSIPLIGKWALLAAGPAGLGYLLARDWHGPLSDGEKTGKPWRFYAVLISGLLILAAVGYLPYAVSKIRFGAERQLLAAGLFIYIALLVPVFFWVMPWIRSRRAEAVVLAVLAGFITVNGLENRASWVDVYRDNERLLSALAATVPRPNPGTTIIVQLDAPQQTSQLAGLDHLETNFEHALQYMYGDATLKGGFVDFVAQPFSAEGRQLEIVIADRQMTPMQVDLDHLLLVDYSTTGDLTVLDRRWLQQKMPPGSDVSAYAPATLYRDTPGPSAFICTMLEVRFRPSYCGAPAKF